MMNQRFVAFVVFMPFVSFVVTPAVASATVVLPADVTELVQSARAVVHGRVIDVRAFWSDDRRRIESHVTIEVAEYFKGDLGSEVTIRVPGGELGRYRSVLIGAPSFVPGDEVVLFLGARGASLPYVLGLSQGVFRVARDGASGEKMVARPLMLARTAAPEPVVRGDPARRLVPLAELERQVRAIAAAR